MSTPLHVLFVCARNRWRSPTAVKACRGDVRLEARSAGLSASSPRRLTVSDLDWADLVLVMESEHRRRILNRFPHRDALPPIRSLDIPDQYAYMDDELVRLLRAATESALSDHLAGGPGRPA